MSAKPAPKHLADSITADINSGLLPPGMQLNEVALAERHHVSRNTLREAFRLLAHDGLVHHKPHRGVFVRQFRASELKDLYAYRRFIELGAVTHAEPGSAHTDSCLQRMRTACARAEAAAVSGSWLTVGTENSAFHQAIIDLVNSPRLSRDGRIALAQCRLVFLAAGEEVHRPFVAGNRQIFSLIDAAEIAEARDTLRDYLHKAEAANLRLAALAE